MFKCDADVNNFCKNEKKLHKKMKALKNHNAILFRLDNKFSSHRDPKNIKKMEKAGYDSSIRDDSSVYGNSNSRYSFILCLRY